MSAWRCSHHDCRQLPGPKGAAKQRVPCKRCVARLPHLRSAQAPAVTVLVHQTLCSLHEAADAGSMYMQARKEATACMSTFRHSSAAGSGSGKPQQGRKREPALHGEQDVNELAAAQERSSIVPYPTAWAGPRMAEAPAPLAGTRMRARRRWGRSCSCRPSPSCSHIWPGCRPGRAQVSGHRRFMRAGPVQVPGSATVNKPASAPSTTPVSCTLLACSSRLAWRRR